MSGYWDPRHSTGARSTQTHGPSSADPSYLVREESPWVVWVQFASVMLILLGSFHAIVEHAVWTTLDAADRVC